MNDYDLEAACHNIQPLLKYSIDELARISESDPEKAFLLQLRALLEEIFQGKGSASSNQQILLHWEGRGPIAFGEIWPDVEQAILLYSQDVPRAIKTLSRLLAWCAIEHYSNYGIVDFSSQITKLIAIQFGINPLKSPPEILGIVSTHTKLLPELLLSKYKKTIGLDLLSINAKSNDIAKSLNAWSEVIHTENLKVSSLKEKLSEYIEVLEKYKTELAFLGLSAAFKNFYNRKRLENWRQLGLLSALAIIVLAAPFLSHYISELFFPSKPGSFDIIQTAFIYLPFIAFEVFGIYFFRVVLLHYNSTQAQLLQLEMKMAACGFIEEYTKFSKENKGADLSRFEALVFGGIVAELNKIPSTFDGIEALAGVVKEIRGK